MEVLRNGNKTAVAINNQVVVVTNNSLVLLVHNIQIMLNMHLPRVEVKGLLQVSHNSHHSVQERQQRQPMMITKRRKMYKSRMVSTMTITISIIRAVNRPDQEVDTLARILTADTRLVFEETRIQHQSIQDLNIMIVCAAMRLTWVS